MPHTRGCWRRKSKVLRSKNLHVSVQRSAIVLEHELVSVLKSLK